MISEIIKNRINLTGIPQAKLAEVIGTTPSQLGLFFKEKASLNNESLEKCLNIVDVNLNVYSKRYNLAQKAAIILKSKDYQLDGIVSLSKDKFIEVTKIKELKYLQDVNEQEFEEILKSEIIDYESTFPFFKVLVMHLFEIGDKFTSKQVENSYKNITDVLNSNAFKKIASWMANMFLSYSAILTFVANDNQAKNHGFFSPLLTLTKYLIEFENHAKK